MNKSNAHILHVDHQSHSTDDIVSVAARAPERLVGVGFRCWLNGLETGDIENWTEAWDTYACVLGCDHAKALLTDVSVFVRAVNANRQRSIEVMGRGCSGFCKDECLAISMIAASQHGDTHTLTETAKTLLGCDDIGDTIIGAQRLAGGLTERRQTLSAESVCPATCALQMMMRSVRVTH